MTVRKTQTMKTFGTILRNDNPEAQTEAMKFATAIPPRKHPDIPVAFDGRATWKDFLSPIKDQEQCGACYAYSTVGALQDRFAIQSLGQVKPNLNPLEAVMCMLDIYSPEEFKSIRTDLAKFEKKQKEKIQEACLGNTMYNAARYLYVQGVGDDNCVSEESIKEYAEQNSGQLPLCSQLEGADVYRCWEDEEKIDTAGRFWLAHQYYTVVDNEITEQSVTNIKLEIMKNGPIAAGFKMYEDFLNEYDGYTVYTHPKKNQKSVGGHAIRIVGWGEEMIDGKLIKYWQIANSWGNDWGDQGYGKIQIMLDGLELEKNVVVTWPEIPGASLYAPLGSITFALSVSTEDDKIKSFYAVDEVLLYSQKQIELIKQGKLKGSLKPFVNPSRLPDAKSFWAFKAGVEPSLLNDGSYALVYVPKSGLSMRIFRIIALIIIIVAVYLLVI